MKAEMTSFSWLHLTDLHCGIKNQDWLWPNVREIVFRDLEMLHEKCGSWDLVLFTGDLTQKGSVKEFEKVTCVLEDIWAFFQNALKFSPQLLAVPGNHDLVRPVTKAIKNPAVKLLLEWEKYPDIQEEFWNEPRSSYRRVVTQTFRNYTVWYENFPHTAPIVNHGLLPGDFSYTFEKDGAKLGIVGLNTSFLQLTGDNYEGRLAVHTKQFHDACDGDGPTWIKAHHVCLLLTHHPPAWLHADFLNNHLHEHITSHGRFAVHLCGHLHEGDYRIREDGGVDAYRLWQGRSLFGLEYIGDKKEIQRSHGYTIGKIGIADEQGALTFWPRTDARPGGQREIIPDFPTIRLTDQQHTKPKMLKLIQPYKKMNQISSCPNIQSSPQNFPDIAIWDRAKEESKLPPALHMKIVNFLISLPDIVDNQSRKAFLFSVGMDTELERQLSIDGSLNNFFRLLIETVLRYGRLNDGRYAIQAILETAKEKVGQDKRLIADKLLQELNQFLKKVEKNSSSSRPEDVSQDVSTSSIESEQFKIPENQKALGSYSNSRFPEIYDSNKPILVFYGDKCGEDAFIQERQRTYDHFTTKYQNVKYIPLDMRTIKWSSIDKRGTADIWETISEIFLQIGIFFLKDAKTDKEKLQWYQMRDFIHTQLRTWRKERTSPKDLNGLTDARNRLFRELSKVLDKYRLILSFEHFEELITEDRDIYRYIIQPLITKKVFTKIIVFSKTSHIPNFFLGSAKQDLSKETESYEIFSG